MNLESIMLSEKSQSNRTLYYAWVYKKCSEYAYAYLEIESKFWVAKGCKDGETWEKYGKTGDILGVRTMF